MKTRNIGKELDAYSAYMKRKPNSSGAFLVTDIKNILDAATDEKTGELDAGDAVGIALRVGYIVGVRAGKREGRK